MLSIFAKKAPSQIFDLDLDTSLGVFRNLSSISDENIRQKQLSFKKQLIFKCQPHKLAKHTQTIRRQKPTNCLGVFDHFVRLALKELTAEVRLVKPKGSAKHLQWSLFLKIAAESPLSSKFTFSCKILTSLLCHP